VVNVGLAEAIQAPRVFAQKSLPYGPLGGQRRPCCAGVDITTIRAWLGHVSLATTNVYADVDLEMKAKPLVSCEVEEQGGEQRPWREDEGMMDLLRA
jgi:hypothetical protein